MLEDFGLETIEDIISRCEEIFDLLTIKGYDHVETIVRKTKILADICGVDIISLWLWLELIGSQEHYSIRNLTCSKNIKNYAFYMWESVHRVKDNEEKSKIYDEMHKKLKEGKSIEELKKKEFSLEYTMLSGLSISELVELAESLPEVPKEMKSRADSFLYRRSLFSHSDSRLIIRRIKNEINDFVSKVYKGAVRKRDKINDIIAELEENTELLRKRMIKYRLIKIWGWIKIHKLTSFIITFIMFIASILGILTFLGYGFEDIMRWFSF